MAGGFPVGMQWAAIQASPPQGSVGFSLSTGASANVLGPYVEMITTTPRTSTWIMVALRDTMTSSGAQVSAVNIAVGSTGSEVVVIPDLVVTRASVAGQEGGGSFYLLPLVVPAGSRIAANCQSTGVASQIIRCAIMLFDDAFASVIGGGVIDALGFNPSTSIGATVDPGSTANVKGAWAQIAASTTYDIAGFGIGIDSQGAQGGSTFAGVDLDIGVGSSGNEVVILPDWQFMMTGSLNGRRDINPAVMPFIPMQIPAGSRIAARAAISLSTGATTIRTFGLTLYGARM